MLLAPTLENERNVIHDLFVSDLDDGFMFFFIGSVGV